MRQSSKVGQQRTQMADASRSHTLLATNGKTSGVLAVMILKKEMNEMGWRWW